MAKPEVANVDLTEWIIEDENERIEKGEKIDDDDDSGGDTDDGDEGEHDDPSDGKESDADDGGGDTDDGDKQDDDKDKPDDDTDKTPPISDETQIAIDDEKVSLAEIKKAWIDRRDQQADYTRKTQALADRRREFESEEKEFADTWERRLTDPNELITYLKRKCPDVLYQAAVNYGTEYQQLKELAKEDPAEYQRYLREEQARLEKINQDEQNKRYVRKERNRVRSLLENHIEPELEKAGLLPKRHGKAYEKLLMSEWYTAYQDFCTANRGTQITEDVIRKISQSLKENKNVVEELKFDQSRYAEKDDKKNGKSKRQDKPKPKIRSVNQDKPTRKQAKDSLTHENFFDRFH
jgi:hypothetical protein